MVAWLSSVKVLSEIELERDRQRDQWGGDEHDDQHDWLDWHGILDKHVQRLICTEKEIDTMADDYRERLVKIAAIAIAALEADDRSND